MFNLDTLEFHLQVPNVLNNYSWIYLCFFSEDWMLNLIILMLLTTQIFFIKNI